MSTETAVQLRLSLQIDFYKMKLTFTLITLACWISFSLALSVAPISPKERCPPKPATVGDLNIADYAGVWYQVAGLPALFQPSGSSCIRANYGLKDDGTLSVRNSLVYPSGSYGEICGYADIPNPEFPGDLQVHFPFTPAGDYWLLDTDYTGYAIVYTCSDVLGLFKSEFAWLLTREKNPSEEVLNKALDAFTAKGVNVENFEPINQGQDCIYDNPEGPNCE